MGIKMVFVINPYIFKLNGIGLNILKNWHLHKHAFAGGALHL